jgi:Holliday junction DNA helicase RuvA
MIARVTGMLETIADGKALIAVEGGLWYELLVPAFAQARLGGMIGQAITLHTIHFLEGSAQGTTFIPRLAGFLTESDRRFFELLTQVKGIGPRKALRVMTLETGQIAGAIADRDAKLLQSLPEIGKRMAETIIITLQDKVEALIDSAVYASIPESAADAATEGPVRSPQRAAAREALEVLVQLGENRAEAIQWIDRALAADESLDETQAIISQVLQMKSGR